MNPKATSNTTLKKQHLKTAIFKSYLRYLEANYSHIQIDNLIIESGLDKDYVLNENNWVSIEFEKKFTDSLKKIIPDGSFLFKVGQFGVQKEVLGNKIHFLFNSMLSLETLLQNLPRITSLLNKVIVTKILSHNIGLLEIELSPRLEILSETDQKILVERLPDFVENIVGYYSAIPTQRGLPPASITVSKQAIQNYHVYILKIQYQPEKKVGEFVYELSFGIAAFFITAGTHLFNSIYASAFFSLLLASSIGWIRSHLKNKSLKVVGEHTRETLEQLDKQYSELYQTQQNLKRQYKESKAISSLISRLILENNPTSLTKNACIALCEELEYDRVVIFLSNPKGSRLEYSNAHGLSDDLQNILPRFSMDIDIDSDDPHKLSNVFRLNQPILVKDVISHLKTLNDPNSKALLELSQSKSFAAVPIRTARQSYGILIADYHNTESTLNIHDINLLTTCGKQIALAIEKNNATIELNKKLQEEKEMAESYSRFVPWETLELLNYKSISDVKLGDGSEKYLAVLFSDIRKFTGLCEDMSPPEVLNFLNSYYGTISPIVKKNKGTIDKFIGDCIMAIFQTPLDAINAGIEIQREIIKYNLQKRIGGRKIINAGIGICYGPTMVGPIGFDSRVEITVLSDTVNIASRLDGLCSSLDAKMLVAGIDLSFLVSKASTNTIDHGLISIKGKEDSVRVFEIVDNNLTHGSEIHYYKNESGPEAQYIESINKWLIQKEISKKAS